MSGTLDRTPTPSLGGFTVYPAPRERSRAEELAEIGMLMGMIGGSLIGGRPMTANGRHPSVAPSKANKRKRKFKGSKAAKKAARLHR